MISFVMILDTSIYSLSSPNSVSTFFSLAKRTMISSFSTLTYGGSLYLQKNTLISLARMSGRFWRSKLIFRSATHWTSGADDINVTMVRSQLDARSMLAGLPNGGAIFRVNDLMRSSRVTFFMCIMIT